MAEPEWTRRALQGFVTARADSAGEFILTDDQGVILTPAGAPLRAPTYEMAQLLATEINAYGAVAYHVTTAHGLQATFQDQHGYPMMPEAEFLALMDRDPHLSVQQPDRLASLLSCSPGLVLLLRRLDVDVSALWDPQHRLTLGREVYAEYAALSPIERLAVSYRFIETGHQCWLYACQHGLGHISTAEYFVSTMFVLGSCLRDGCDPKNYRSAFEKRVSNVAIIADYLRLARMHRRARARQDLGRQAWFRSLPQPAGDVVADCHLQLLGSADSSHAWNTLIVQCGKALELALEHGVFQPFRAHADLRVPPINMEIQLKGSGEKMVERLMVSLDGGQRPLGCREMLGLLGKTRGRDRSHPVFVTLRWVVEHETLLPGATKTSVFKGADTILEKRNKAVHQAGLFSREDAADVYASLQQVFADMADPG